MNKQEFKTMLKACGEKKTDNEIECMVNTIVEKNHLHPIEK